MNILLITSEDNGQELSCYGDPYIKTPHLDRLAMNGTFFRNAYITQAVCSPSRCSILTGLYPHQSGQIGLSTHFYSMHREFPSLPTLLKNNGYRTGRLGKLHVLPESAFDFDFVWNDPEYISFWHRDMDRTAEVAGRFMSESDQPFFLMVNYPDAHLPWLRQERGVPSKPFCPWEVAVPEGVGVDSSRLRQHAADYYNCLARLDLGIGKLLDQLQRTGQYDNTLIIYLADHGPQFSRGKAASYELAVKVPFIIQWPGMQTHGLDQEHLISSIDIMPTILDAAGIAVPSHLPGKSLRLLLENKAENWREHLFSEWNSSHVCPLPSFLYPQRTVRNNKYKLILTMLTNKSNPIEEYYTKHVLIDTGTTQWEIDHAQDKHVQRIYDAWRRPQPIELYDLHNDPWEFNDLSQDPAYSHIKEELLQVLQEWQEATADPLANPALLSKLVEEHEILAQKGDYRKEPGFRWNYLNYLYNDARDR